MRKRLLERRPVGCRVFLKIDLDRPALLDAPLQQRRLVAECPALDGEQLVVGQVAERLAGLDLLAKLDLQFLHLEGERLLVGRTIAIVERVSALASDFERMLAAARRGDFADNLPSATPSMSSRDKPRLSSSCR